MQTKREERTFYAAYKHINLTVEVKNAIAPFVEFTMQNDDSDWADRSHSEIAAEFKNFLNR